MGDLALDIYGHGGPPPPRGYQAPCGCVYHWETAVIVMMCRGHARFRQPDRLHTAAQILARIEARVKGA